MKNCSIDGCCNAILARGWCRTHYLRWYKHGDPLTVIDQKATAKRGADLPQFKHGAWSHPLYQIWSGMMGRCHSETHQRFSGYGGRGITVCSRWHDVQNFIEDMSPRPDGMSIDRIDNDGNYSPENCRWANALTQARNRPQATTSDIQREDVIARYSKCRSPSIIASQTGLSIHIVKKIVRTLEKIKGVAS